jgi:hypothetical protein
MITLFLTVVGSVSSGVGLVIQIWMLIDYRKAKSKAEKM